MRRIPSYLAFAILAATAWGEETFERAYWVWHRAQPLTAKEKADLTKQNVRTLYWSLGELENQRGAWRWKAAPLQLEALAPPAFHVVPVVRLTSEEKAPFAAAAMPPLLNAL